MNTLLLSHPACRGPDTGPGHPECAERLLAVGAALEAEAFMLLDRREAPRATIGQLARVHSQGHLERLLRPAAGGERRALDADTVISAGSAEAALRAAGAVVEAEIGRAHV